jgi:hypothetical protein
MVFLLLVGTTKNGADPKWTSAVGLIDLRVQFGQFLDSQSITGTLADKPAGADHLLRARITPHNRKEAFGMVDAECRGGEDFRISL